MSNSLDDALGRLNLEYASRREKSSKMLSTARRAIGQGLSSGEVPRVRRAALQAGQLLRAEADACDRIVEGLDSFDFDKYFGAEFERELFSECEHQGIGIRGVFPRYFVSSILIELKPQASEVLINGRTTRALRITTIVDAIKAELQGLQVNGAPPEEFAATLAAAYDMEVAELTHGDSSVREGLEIPLLRIYRRLTPERMQRLKYPIRQFEHDIHAMLSAGIDVVEGRRVVLKAARSRKSSLRVVLPGGAEVYYGSVSLQRMG